MDITIISRFTGVYGALETGAKPRDERTIRDNKKKKGTRIEIRRSILILGVQS